jgi:outer membrane protein assembly factor BamB
MVVAGLLADKDFRFVGMILVGLPLASTAWVAWLLVTPMLSWPVRRAGLVVVLLLVCGYCDARRIDGADGSFSLETSWRWAPTAEQLAQAEIAERTSDPKAVSGPVKALSGDWPGFRGPNRDGRRPGVQIAVDWDSREPQMLWRQRVGPGWSSMAVVGDRLYTQEQRGDREAVVCYRASTGQQVWIHEDDARFSETVSGAGPRATPTIDQGKVYALGAEGHLNCLDAATGRRVWVRDIAKDSGAKRPTWGFSSSPLVVRGVVMVFAGGPDGKGTLGYDAADGTPKWAAGKGRHSYCSPQLSRLDGREQVLVTTDEGLTALEPKTGKVLWEHDSPSPGNDEGRLPRVIQPAVVDDSHVLLGTGFNGGTALLHVKRESGEPVIEEVWTTTAISPYYNDLVVHKGHLYGFDGFFFTCVELEEGKSRWRARGYGNGQVLLLPDQDLLIVLSEKGEVALLEATPSGHRRLGKFKALEGKTWNHPVLAHGKLFVRNGQKMACFELNRSEAGADD